MTQRTYTGKFLKLAGEWRVVVNTGTPQVGDEIHVRRADKSVSTVIVKELTGTFNGKSQCRFGERKTESAYSIKHLAGEIIPADYPIDPRRAARAAKSQFVREYGGDCDDEYSGYRRPRNMPRNY